MHRKLLIIAAVVVVVFALLFSSLFVPIAGDAMNWQSRRLMGRHGIDCGTVTVRADAKTATDCALKAQAEGKPFRVRYDIMGYDSQVAGGIVRTPSGQLYGLSYQGTSLFHQQVLKTPCPQPTHLWINPKGRINCFQQQLSPPANLMSPNAEPY